MTDQTTVVTFGIGKAFFALPVDPVVEILEARETAPLPRAPRHLLGLIDRRGASVPVVDMRALLGQPERADGLDTRIIVIAFVAEGQPERLVGLRVDQVLDVGTIQQDVEMPGADAGILRWRERMVAGVGKRGDDFVTILDVEGLLGSELGELELPGLVA
ncbi:chemotaxis protein CheW [Pararhodobacter sp. CCB-MM2]|uniref:chemotaxis protein CheW n=1 Tax=Pararhodobacter sp. CCB-MM2 TaxID=1786003 RepID=UPI000834C34E|nr:chemotaxis protein CheW [Pararhodobacter sp. CCB-MM2]